MFKIKHVGFGILHCDGDDLTFQSEHEAKEYLSHCNELVNLGTEWEIVYA